jgi:hypothetical protein
MKRIGKCLQSLINVCGVGANLFFLLKVFTSLDKQANILRGAVSMLLQYILCASIAVQQWSLAVCRMFHARPRRCPFAGRNVDLSHLPCRDQQNVGDQKFGRGERRFGTAVRVPLLQPPVPEELAGEARRRGVRGEVHLHKTTSGQ